jgi:hypothetical protein
LEYREGIDALMRAMDAADTPTIVNLKRPSAVKK